MIIPVLALLGMVACTNENEPEIVIDNNEPVEIKMVASIVDVNAKTKAAINPGAALTGVTFLRTDGTAKPDWATVTPTSIPTSIAATSGAITFEPIQYYSADATQNAYFVGYYPSGTLANGVVTFTGMDGSQDIMYAQEVSGNKTNTTLAAAFVHKLAQLQFKFKKDATFQGTDVKVTSIIIKGTQLPESLNIKDGTIKYATSSTPITAFTGGTYPMDESLVTPANNLVQVGANAIKLDITLDNGATFNDVSVTLTTKETTAHVITLTFKQASATGNATIGTWASEDAGNTDIQ